MIGVASSCAARERSKSVVVMLVGLAEYLHELPADFHDGPLVGLLLALPVFKLHERYDFRHSLRRRWLGTVKEESPYPWETRASLFARAIDKLAEVMVPGYDDRTLAGTLVPAKIVRGLGHQLIDCSARENDAR